MSAFVKDDDERIRSLRIDILHQSESLANKINKRRRAKGVFAHGKRGSIYQPDGSAMSQSFFIGGIEDTFTSDNMFAGDNMHSFNFDLSDNQDFNILDELDNYTNLFDKMNKSDEELQNTQASPTQKEDDSKIAEFEQKKKEAIADVKR